jgi:hypothetical protein
MASTARKHTRRSSFGHELELKLLPAVQLEKCTFRLRSDQAKQLRAVALDLALDDYDFSQAEMVRAALDDFQRRPLVQQVQRLERLREREKLLGVGIEAARPRRGR